MRMSELFLSTLREVPTEAETISHQLMLRGGIIRKLAAGVYSYLPLGVRVLKKVENIVKYIGKSHHGEEYNGSQNIKRLWRNNSF